MAKRKRTEKPQQAIVSYTPMESHEEVTPYFFLATLSLETSGNSIAEIFTYQMGPTYLALSKQKWD